MDTGIKRRAFVKRAALTVMAGALPVSLVELAFGKQAGNVTFACISDSHVQHIGGSSFVRNLDRALKQAVAEANLLAPRPDFILFGGDLAQHGTRAELDHGAEIMSALRSKVHYVMGEHDYYLDLGKRWSELFGPQYYSFDVKGVHFVVLNSVLTFDGWTHDRWPSAAQRMNAMAGLDNPNGSPFMVGETQRAWLREDLARLGRQTPVVVFSHAPLQKIHKQWNFWTDDAELVHEILQPFEHVTVMYGHVHQVQHNRIGNIRFHSVMATAWPWPHPGTYAQGAGYLPRLAVPMNGADDTVEREATGWQFINVNTGNMELAYERRGVALVPGKH